MKILVTGSAGFVGKNIFNNLKNKHQMFGISRRNSLTTTHTQDITDKNIETILNELNPDIIIHSAALSSVDYCESHKEEAWNTNVLGTENLVNWCKKNSKKMIYISTDYVYPGISNNYDENSEVSPISVYGITKLEAERKVQTLKYWTILRPTVIFGYDEGGNNFLMQMLALKEKRKIPFDQISNPTDVKVLCEYIDKVIDSKIEGIFIATGPETIDRYEFALLIAKIFNIDENLLERTSTVEFNQIAKRPLNNGTNSSKLRSILNYKCLTLHQSLESIKNQISKAH
ncbi:SDR family oxidoreductase [Candidatus Pacearchaeota archaeon]|nr:SDR family oxidoreductase [Candidatus Pacearchaeota archaeon]